MSGAHEIIPGLTPETPDPLLPDETQVLAAPPEAVASTPPPAPEPPRAAAPQPDMVNALEWPTRILFALVLVAVALMALGAGGLWFAGFVALVAAAAAREWHRLVGAPNFGFEAIVTAVTIAGTLAAMVLGKDSIGGWAILLLFPGAAAVGAIAKWRGTSVAWNAAGPLYLGLPSACFVALDLFARHNSYVVFVIFVITWAADTGALLTGKVIGGPKLAPSISPNKTWAGLMGGIVLPALFGAALVAILGGDAQSATLFAIALALVGHAGDLFESWVKRRVGRKNSGGLIPGHGGMLDRIDGALFIGVAAGIAVFVFDVDPLFGALK